MNHASPSRLPAILSRPAPRHRPVDRHYRARYLVLLGDESAQRALLFDTNCHYLAELIDDDGLVLDNLVRSGTACLPPAELGFDAPRVAQAVKVECFSLG